MSCPRVPHTFIFIFQLANPMKLHKFSFLLLCHVVRVLWPGVKLWDQVCSHRQLAAPPTRLPAVVLTENCSRQRMKKHGFPGPKARTVGFALPDWPREKGMAQSASKGHWSDEKIIQHPHPHPPPLPQLLDLMQRQTICEQWQSQIGPKGYEWETSKPAHISVDVKGFV